METEITDIGKVAITPQKDYQNERTYEWLDVVTYDGAGYMCIAEDGCTGIVPTNTEYWQLLADKGHFTKEDKEEFKKAVVEESKTEINEHTGNKKTELNNYTTELEKSLENELDTYKTEKEAQMDLHKATLETEMANKKDSLIEEIETAQDGFDANVEEKTNTFNSNVETKTTEFNNNSNAKIEEFNNNSTEKINTFNSNAEEKIAEYDAHAESVLTETEDLFNALNTEKASGNELYIEDAKPCRVINTGVNGMYKQETTSGTNLMNLNVAQSSKVTVNEDGTITINGTGGFGLVFESFTFKANIPYYIKWEIVSGNIPTDLSLVFLSPINSKWLTKDIFNTITPTEDKESSSLWIHQNAKFENAKIRIWISESKSDFEPYTGKIPSPNRDYPQAIEQVESVILKSVNKNWYPFNDIKITSKKTTAEWVFVDGAAGAYGTTIGNRTSYKFKLLKGVYTIKCSKTNSNVVTFQIVDERERIYMNLSTTNFTTTITLNEDKILIVRIRLTNPSLGADISDLQIEKGTTATNYEPSQNKAINVDLKGNKLCAISDTIKDKLLIDRNGNVALQKNVEKNIFDGTKKWKKSSYTENTIFYLTNTQKAKFPDVGICNYLPVKKVWNVDILGLELYDLNNIRVGLTRKSEIQTEDAFNEWLTTHNLEVYYALATPELIDLGQLPELLKTFNGINNIWAETNLGNTEIEVEYVQDVKKLLEQQNARLDNIEALLSTTETSALLLDNMQNDLEKEVE